jgi:hypothetical protein
VGARPDEIEAIARAMAEKGQIKRDVAKALLDELRASS